MKILITGASGLIGSKLIAHLSEQNHTIHYLSTSKSKLNLPNAKGFYWNPKNDEIDIEAFNEVEAIIHLAGATVAKRWTAKYKEEIKASRVEPTRLLYKTLSENEHSIKHIISASAIGIYPSSYNNIYDELETDVDQSFLGEVVKIWESEVEKFKDLPIKVSKIRIGLVLAQEGGALKEIEKPIKLGFGSNLGNGKQMQSWIHINDLVKIFHHVLQHKLEGVFNGVAPNPVTNEQMTKLIAKTLNKPLFMPNVPAFALKLILGEMHYLLVSSQNISSQKIQQFGFNFQFETLKSALNDIYKNH